MLVIADTSPLNYLVLLGEVRLLPALFGSVTTTPAVLRELADAGSPEVVRGFAIRPPDWLLSRSPAALVPTLPRTLGDGEIEAISLACEIRADLILIDEREGAATAESFGLEVTGTLGVLTRAASGRLIDLDLTIERLKQTSFRASAALYARVLREHRGRQH